MSEESRFQPGRQPIQRRRRWLGVTVTLLVACAGLLIASYAISPRSVAAEPHIVRRVRHWLLWLRPTPSDRWILRGPYLQLCTPNSVILRWRTAVPMPSTVLLGPAPDALTRTVETVTPAKEHEVRLDGLEPDSRYCYAIRGNDSILMGGDESHCFSTAPAVGSAGPVRMWVLGDSGTGDKSAKAVKDAYYRHFDPSRTDLWLMLGDNAYPDGSDTDYQAGVFDMYPEMLRSVTLWPTLGNHDDRSADSGSQSGVYYDVFSLPTRGEAGGVGSGTEAYYSFDYANIHFICMNSCDVDRKEGSSMLKWLEQDLNDTRQNWVIAFWHHPPYSKGSHNSDLETGLIDMRENVVPILEAGGADVILTGHSHSYERSYFLTGHYGESVTLTPSMIVDGGDGRRSGDGAYRKSEAGLVSNSGSVYVVAGSSGQTGWGPLNHPAMYVAMRELGSLVIDVEQNQLDAQFVDERGNVRDAFSIQKQSGAVPQAPAVVSVQPLEEGVQLSWLDLGTKLGRIEIEVSEDRHVWQSMATVAPGATTVELRGLRAKTTYFGRIRSVTAMGSSPYCYPVEFRTGR